MKDHYIDKVNVIIDGENCQIVTIIGTKYNPDIVKNKAILMVKDSFPNSKITAVISEHNDVTLEEYKKITSSNLPWFQIVN